MRAASGRPMNPQPGASAPSPDSATGPLDRFAGLAVDLLPLLTTIAVALGIIALLNWWLRKRWHGDPNAQFRFQLIMLGLTIAAILAVVIALPVTDAVRSDLLSLIGILLSAAIALSSTTFIGNIMAGMMLRILKSARPGDFITVEELTGRITEMDLLHTEIQTEFRDLVTVPNLHLVTRPLKVVRASGTIISGEVSLGYDVPQSRVFEVLKGAAEKAELKEPFVHVRELGDFSVLYRVAGLLEDVKSLISARSRLREAMIDALHAADIEIVSPNFMSTRALPPEQPIIPAPVTTAAREARAQAESVAFDKAEEAASVEQIRLALEGVDSQLKETHEGETAEAAAARREKLEAKKARLVARLAAAEKAREDAEKAERTNG